MIVDDQDPYTMKFLTYKHGHRADIPQLGGFDTRFVTRFAGIRARGA
jgi:hypothetical protein